MEKHSRNLIQQVSKQSTIIIDRFGQNKVRTHSLQKVFGRIFFNHVSDNGIELGDVVTCNTESGHHDRILDWTCDNTAVHTLRNRSHTCTCTCDCVH